MKLSEEYLAALHNPVVEWKKPVQDSTAEHAAGEGNFETVKVWNAAIEPDMFTIEFDGFGTRGAKAHITTPTLRLESIGTADEQTNLETKDFYTSLYLDPETVVDYADCKDWTQERLGQSGPKRYSMFAERWSQGQLHSGFVAYDSEDKPVGIVNIGGSGRANVAEFACMIHSKEQKKHYGAELSMLLFSYPKTVQSLGCMLPDGTEPVAVTATAKHGHGSDKILGRLGLTVTNANDERYNVVRNVYEDTIEDLSQVLDNTRLRNTLR